MSQGRTAATPKPRRRTQAERSAATRARLLTATAESLYELGFHKTTTYSVEQRAGVTRGALLHHFASKSALLVAAVEHMVDAAQQQLEAEAAKLPGDDLAGELTDLLWQQFTSPTFFAFLEISVAARTDEALREALVASQERLDASCRAVARKIARQLDGAAIDDTTFDTGLELTIRYLRGAAGTTMLSKNPERHDDLHREWQRIVAPYFTTSAKKNRRTSRPR